MPNLRIKYVPNTFLNLPTVGRLMLLSVEVFEWLGGLLIEGGVLNSNSGAIGMKRLLHALSLCHWERTIVCASGSTTNWLSISKGFT